MNPILLLFLILILAKARTRRDRLKATLVIMAVLSQQQGHANLANLRRMVRNTSDDSVVVHLLAALSEEPTWQPTLRDDVESPDPYTRRETYRRLLFSIKPADFNLECD